MDRRKSESDGNSTPNSTSSTSGKQRLSFTTKNKASEKTWCGPSPRHVPLKNLEELDSKIFASYTGPEDGLMLIHGMLNSNEEEQYDKLGAENWMTKSRKAYGIAMSLYDQHPYSGKISGDPIADAFAICSRMNNALLLVADGVNWGEKSKMAARCATYGCVKYINEHLFSETKKIKTTQDAMQLLLDAIWAAHRTILQLEAGLTTLCIALVLPLALCKQYVVCVANVGDSLAFLFSKYHGIREVTVGSHDTSLERDIRDAGGALGPVNGTEPELHNLTFSMTIVDPGDILFLTTDGISDNFDPVVTKIALGMRRHSVPNAMDPSQPVNAPKPEMSPKERHQYSVKEMERIVHEFELDTEQSVSAQELCGAILQHVVKLTDPKRKVLENPELFKKKLKLKERKRRDSIIVDQMSKAPGKLDHATIIAYEIGHYHGDDDENYETDSIDDVFDETPPLNSPCTPQPNSPMSKLSYETNM